MHVLLVTGSRPMAWAIGQGLEGQGFAADTAEGGAQADHKVHSSPYHVILLDLQLAGEDGLSLLRRWRRSGLRAHVLVLAARAAVVDTVNALDAGADDCLSRPFQWAELLARLRALSRRGLEVHDPTLRVYDLEINTAARTVKRGGRPIRLSRREYALLELLACHRGRAVSRPAILQHLSGDPRASISNSVAVCIRSLRVKVDVGFEPPLILTSPREGYLLRGTEPRT